MSPRVQLDNDLKNIAELFYSLGLEADRYKNQYENSNVLTNSAKSKLQTQYTEKVQQMNHLINNLSLESILMMDDYLNQKYGYHS